MEPGIPRSWQPGEVLTRCVLLAATAVPEPDGTLLRMSYASDLTDEQWALLEPVFNAPGKRGPKHAPDLRQGSCSEKCRPK
jgi:hypothetical protein